MSRLAVYLEFRNRILFVRQLYPKWLAWTVAMQIVHALTFGVVGAFRSIPLALQGVYAGLMGETGRPDHIITPRPPRAAGVADFKRRTKIAISCIYLMGDRIIRRVAWMCGHKPRGTLVILCYHSVPPWLKGRFAHQMTVLSQRARVVPSDWHGAPDGPAHAVAITFDDAYVGVFEQALPILAQHGFACTIFVPPGSLGRRPDWSMEPHVTREEPVVDADGLRKMHGPLVTIGAHTMTHPHLTAIPTDLARSEIRGAREKLTELLGCPVTQFAFPYGDHNALVADLCRQEGYEHAFTISPKPVIPGDRSLLRGRIGVDPTDGHLEFTLKISGAYAWLPFVSGLMRRLSAMRSRPPPLMAQLAD